MIASIAQSLRRLVSAVVVLCHPTGPFVQANCLESFTVSEEAQTEDRFEARANAVSMRSGMRSIRSSAQKDCVVIHVDKTSPKKSHVHDEPREKNSC